MSLKSEEKGGGGRGVAVYSEIVPNVTKFGMQSPFIISRYILNVKSNLTSGSPLSRPYYPESRKKARSLRHS